MIQNNESIIKLIDSVNSYYNKEIFDKNNTYLSDISRCLLDKNSLHLLLKIVFDNDNNSSDIQKEYFLSNLIYYQNLDIDIIDNIILNRKYFDTDPHNIYRHLIRHQYIPEEYFINRPDIISDDDNLCNAIKFQKLSEKFLKDIIKSKAEFKYFNELSACQNLSEDFIEEYKDELNWPYILAFQNLSEEFIEKHKSYCRKNLVSTFHDKNKLINRLTNCSFECYDNYFIAFIPLNIYSIYRSSNFMIRISETGIYAKPDHLGYSSWFNLFGNRSLGEEKIAICKVNYDNLRLNPLSIIAGGWLDGIRISGYISDKIEVIGFINKYNKYVIE